MKNFTTNVVLTIVQSSPNTILRYPALISIASHSHKSINAHTILRYIYIQGPRYQQPAAAVRVYMPILAYSASDSVSPGVRVERPGASLQRESAHGANLAETAYLRSIPSGLISTPSDLNTSSFSSRLSSENGRTLTYAVSLRALCARDLGRCSRRAS
jgi:hypothetical protein